jgi:hypothetical protein
MKLDIKAFALTCGIFWGLAIFALTWWVIAFKGASEDSISLLKLYPGYTVTPIGSLIGMAEGFVDMLIGGAIFAWLYNKLSTCKKKT